MQLKELKKMYETHYTQFHVLNEVVSNILTTAIQKKGYKIHSLKLRVKQFESFADKCKRKRYTHPLKQCHDISGCRVVCLFSDQVDDIGKLIQTHFKVAEKTEKRKAEDSFAYNAVHYVVQLKQGSCKEYDDLKQFYCEIQLHTILQEAWSEIEHYVNYKQIGVDKDAVRKINALSALFEIADDQFSSIYKEFDALQSSKSVAKQATLSATLLYHYCRKKFPWAWKGQFDGLNSLQRYQEIVDLCHKKRIYSISEVDALYTKHSDDVFVHEQFHVKEILNSPHQWAGLYNNIKKTGHFYSPFVILSQIIQKA